MGDPSIGNRPASDRTGVVAFRSRATWRKAAVALALAATALVSAACGGSGGSNGTSGGGSAPTTTVKGGFGY